LLNEVGQAGAEDQIAFRDGRRYVARLGYHLQGADGAFDVRPDATYLITGGLRGVGLRFAGWLVEQGARHLVLMGRSGAADAARPALDEMERQGARVVVAKADATKADDLARVLNDIQREMPPLKGIIHSAAVLDDGVLLGQDGARFEKVMQPKVAGTWNLHSLTRDLPLDFFVVFSSFASSFGSAGQSNYAAGNAFMDALMHHRRALGLPGLSIHWGAWGEIGLAADMDEYFQRIGLQMMKPAAAIAALPYVLRSGTADAIVASVDWDAFRLVYAGRRERPLLDGVAIRTGATAGETRVNFADVLEQAAPGERHGLLLNQIRDEVATVLGFAPAEALDLRRGFFKMGMDSLMSVQLRNRLENRLGCFLPPTVALEYPTVEALTDYIAAEVFKIAQGDEMPPAPEPEVLPDAGAKLEGLSDDELMALLDDELAAIDKLTGDE
jgi:NAD(P)-dependent dehydrogenase (short-subunit alcohol dehydrogenase family)/acyl carrier protein